MKTPFKLRSGNKSSFKDMGSSPIYQKGDNLKRIMSENKAAQKKAGTWYKKDSMPKGFNVKGSGGAGNIWQKGKDLAKKAFKGASKGNVLALMLGATKTATADQPKFKKGDVHYQDPKKKIDFTKKK
tara:strand:+ start:83 stop:463 length:381 start_codon:yes stop_codon:yes gene_type:complete